MDPSVGNNEATDTDVLPSLLAIDDVTVGDAGNPAVFTVTLAPASPLTVTVAYATVDGTALSGSDYTATSGLLSFAPGATTQTVTVPVAPEATIEDTKTFFMRLSAATSGLLSKATGQAWILNSQKGQRVEFSASNYSVSQAGHAATITVTRIGGTSGTVTVDYATSDGSARAGVNYTTTAGIVAFEPGDVSRTFTVPVTNDALDEGNTTVLLELSNPRGGAVLGETTTAVLTIVDTNVAGSVQFSSPTYSVEETGSLATITVIRKKGTADGVTVDYLASGGSAIPGQEYVATSGTLSFAAGIRSRTFVVPILDDGAVGADSTVNLTLSNARGGATLATPSAAVLTIAEDNPVLQFSAANYSVSEAGARATIVVKLLHSAATAVHVTYATSPGSAVPGVDYKDTSGILTFLPGQATRTFSVSLLKDGVADGNRTVLLALSNPDVGALGQPNTAVLTIPDINKAGVVQFSSDTYGIAQEAHSARIYVTRTGGAAGGVTVDYATQDGSAFAGTNYVATSGTLSFGPGVFRQTISVPILDDGEVHGNLYAFLSLSNVQGGASFGDSSFAFATLEILSDDPLLEFSRYSYTVGEKGRQAVITVNRLGPATQAVTVDYSTIDGTAVAGTDYTATSGTLSFGRGVTDRTFTVPVTDDALIDGDQWLQLYLGNPQGGALGDVAFAVLTITTDDPRLEFSQSNYVVAASATQATITVRRRGPARGAVSVHYATFGHVAVTGRLTFPPTVTAKAFQVPLSGDLGGEAIPLALCSPSGAVLGDKSTALLTIKTPASPGPVQFSATDYSVSETGPVATITITRTGSTAETATVDYATSDGSAAAETNYVPAAGTLVFGKNEKKKTFTIEVLDDGSRSGNHTVGLNLRHPVGTTLGTNDQATLWIVENR